MLGTKIAIDFGSSNITVFVDGKSIVSCEPSMIVCDSYTERPIAFGNDAKAMIGKLPESMKVVYPIRDGIVSDYDKACLMLRRYINKYCYGKLFRPNILMCVPSTVTTLEKKTIFDCVMSAGAGRACFVEESLAAAIGSGISLTEPKGICICDIGGGTTDCAVVTMGNIAVSKSVKVGGNDLTNTISSYILHQFNVMIGRAEAEQIKVAVGAAILRNEETAVIACGKNCDTSLPEYFEITSTEVYWILKNQVEEIVSCIRSVLEITPPDLCADIADTGIILTGGTANLFGLDTYISRSTGLVTKKAASPEQCAAIGMGRIIRNMLYLEKNGYVFASVDDNFDENEDY